MKQTAAVFTGHASIQVELPPSETEVLPGVPWGAVEAFPSPAYWTYQVLARRLTAQPVRYRLGQTLSEEVGACLLGGHGIPAEVGLAAFAKMKAAGVFGRPTSEGELLALLSEKLMVNGRLVGYRFARQKAGYLKAALDRLSREMPPMETGRQLRDWLIDLPGIGCKTASWIARNWLDASDVAILDIHVLRAGFIAGFFSPELTVERDYLRLEKEFLAFSLAVGVRAAELDAVIWSEMMSSPATVRALMGGHRQGVMPGRAAKRSRTSVGTRAQQHDTNTNQRSLID